MDPVSDFSKAPRALWRCKMFRDITVDAMVLDDSGYIMLLSCFGRDTAMNQFLAAFHLPVRQGGIDTVLLDPQTEAAGTFSSRGFLGDPQRFEKFTSKLPRRSLFGELTHTMIYDPKLTEADKANGIAWVLTQGGVERTEEHQAKIWAALKTLAPVPLLDHWQRPLLQAIKPLIKYMNNHERYQPSGNVLATRIELNDSFVLTLSELVKTRVLTREPMLGLEFSGGDVIDVAVAA